MLQLQKHKGFSILMALGITAILMIMVSGLAVLYMREFKLSRLSYDEILASTSAEWMFEYGMLKIRNHADGFKDAVNTASGDLDSKMFQLATPRSQGLNMQYEMDTQSMDKTFLVGANEFLVIPLGVGNDEILSNQSKKPTQNPEIEVSEGLIVKGINGDVVWTIAARDKSNNSSVWLQGSWAIDASTIWTMRLRAYRCSEINGGALTTKSDSNMPCVFSTWATTTEELMYFHDVSGTVSDFMEQRPKNFWSGRGQQIDVIYSDFYLILYNNSSEEKNVIIKTNSAFALPQYSITATATKWDASQIFRFSEDKSGVYDALKYGYYDPSE